MYTYDHAPVCNICKVDIAEAAAALAATEPLISSTKVSVPLTDLNKNSVDSLTAALTTELSRKRRYAEEISAEQE